MRRLGLHAEPQANSLLCPMQSDLFRLANVVQLRCDGGIFRRINWGLTEEDSGEDQTEQGNPETAPRLPLLGMIRVMLMSNPFACHDGFPFPQQ